MPPSMTDHNIQDSPPHEQAQGSNPAASSSATPATTAQALNLQAPPAMDPALQAAMAAFFTAMTQQFQAQVANPQPVNLPDPHQYQPAPRSRIKTWDPDPYDGSDPAKLCSFLSQCKLVFWSWPDKYRHDHAKIMFMASWLKGTAQWWFKPILALEDHKLPWYACEWEHFEDALNSTFGEPDPIASATHKLNNLVMKDYHHLNKYNVDFNEYATITGFDKHTLYAHYYKGLAPPDQGRPGLQWPSTYPCKALRMSPRTQPAPLGAQGQRKIHDNCLQIIRLFQFQVLQYHSGYVIQHIKGYLNIQKPFQIINAIIIFSKIPEARSFKNSGSQQKTPARREGVS